MTMAGRSIQNSLRFLSSPSPTFQISLKPPTIRTHRTPKCSSSGGGALYCTCRIADDPFVLTTPLYYGNAPPHMGSAYTTIAADAIARFQRLLGKKVIFTGTDEHGEKIASAAAASGSNPIEHCDSISQAYKALWREDILWFHTVYWPAMSSGLSLPKKVFGHGFLTKVEKAQQHYENLEPSTACETVLEIGNVGNVNIDEKAPRSLVKQGGAAFETAAKLACPTSALFRTSFSFLRKFSSSVSAGEAEGTSTNKPKRKKKKNFFEVAQFLTNWGIGYHMAKTHWTGVSYQITKINLYKDGRHGKAWGIAHKAGVPTTEAPKKISGVHKRCWRYIANSNKTEENTSKSELQTV